MVDKKGMKFYRMHVLVYSMGTKKHAEQLLSTTLHTPYLAEV